MIRMTPKEKAKQLLWEYLPILESWKEDNSNKAKQCALIAVNDILSLGKKIPLEVLEYYVEVKIEIEKS